MLPVEKLAHVPAGGWIEEGVRARVRVTRRRDLRAGEAGGGVGADEVELRARQVAEVARVYLVDLGVRL